MSSGISGILKNDSIMLSLRSLFAPNHLDPFATKPLHLQTQGAGGMGVKPLRYNNNKQIYYYGFS